MKTPKNPSLFSTCLVAAIIALVVTLGSSWVIPRIYPPEGQNLPSQSVYDAVKARGTIRAAYFVGAPLFMLDPNTKQKSGIFHDVVESVAQRLNLRVEWTEEVGFGDMAEGLKVRRFDIVGSGVWINAARGAVADFSIPVVYDAVCAYSRFDDHRFDEDISKANAKEVRISTIDGEMAATIARSDFPQASIVSLPQNSDFTQMILNVANNKADLTFLGLGPARKYEAANPNQIRNITKGQPIRVFPTAIMLPASQYAFKREIDLALIELQNSGESESIIKRYEDTPGSHLRVAPGYIESTR